MPPDARRVTATGPGPGRAVASAARAAPARAAAGRRGLAAGLTLAASLGPLAGCGSLRQFGPGEHTPPAKNYTVGGRVTTVIINGGGGSIDVTGSPGRRAIAVSEQASYSKDAPVATHTVRGSALTLSYTCPPQLLCGMSYVIQVPRGVAVQAHTSAGSVTLTSLAGPVTASTNAGLITAVDLSSPTAAFKSNAGSVIATFSAPPGTLDAATNVGPITLTVPGSVAYKVSTRTVVGASTVTVRKSAASPHAISARSDVGSISVNPS